MPRVVEHLDGTTLKNVLHAIILHHHLIGLATFSVNYTEVINRIDFNSLCNIYSLLQNVLSNLFTLVVGFQIVEIYYLVFFVVG